MKAFDRIAPMPVQYTNICTVHSQQQQYQSALDPEFARGGTCTDRSQPNTNYVKSGMQTLLAGHGYSLSLPF